MARELRPVEVKLSGEYACFTRPEMKVERVSYPLMTPSAARGALEAIYWKPEFRWRVGEIWVLHPIQYFSIRRNEVNSRQSERVAAGWASGGGGYDASADRAQRHTLGLRKVAYLVRAQVEPWTGGEAESAKHRDQFRRRVRAGRCFATPYLGCREFAAAFEEPDGSERGIDLSEDLGPMLLDLAYEPGGSGRAAPVFFDARLIHGVLHVPTMPAPVAAG